MDFSSIVTNAGVTSVRRPADLQFLIQDIIAETDLEETAGRGAAESGKRYGKLEVIEGGAKNNY